jgi:integrase
MLVRQLLDTEYAVIRSLKPTAAYQFRLTLDRWGQFLGHPPELADLEPLRVQSFLNHRRTVVAAATARKDRTHIVALWSHAAKRRLVDEFPTLPPIRAPQRIPRAYRVQDVSAIIRAASTLPGTVCGMPASVWWSCIIRLCWETAERIGAVLQLRWDDVELDERYVVFRGETRKGSVRDLRRDISADLAEQLRKMQRKPNDVVFGWDRQYTSLWFALRQICGAANVTPRGFHGFRKAAASYVAAAGGDATQLLDHSNPKLAKDHYLDESIVRPRSTAIDLLPALSLQPPEALDTPEARQVAVDAGKAAGRRLRAAGEPKPNRKTQDALAAAEGVAISLLPQYRWGVVMGWLEESAA